METPNMFSQRWIKGYEGIYSCNARGQIFRHWKNKKQTELMGYIAKGNKHIVKLIKDNQVKEFIVSRIIFETWIGPIPENCIVVRKNKNLRDSHVENLKLTTYKIHNVLTGAKAKSKPVELLDDADKVINSWPSARKAAKDLFVSYQTIIDICNGKTKKKMFNVRWENSFRHKDVEYAIYKGEDLLTLGTITEVATELGKKEETIKYYMTPSYKKRANLAGTRSAQLVGS